MKISCFLLQFILFSPTVFSQHFRGLSVVNDNLVWMGGSKGTVLRSVNGGNSWDTLNPAGYSGKDFRDIHAWNAKHAIVLSAGDSGVVLETTDGGMTWNLIYHDYTPGVFFDAFDVRGNNIILVGDGIAGNNPYLLYIDKHRHITPFQTKYFQGNSESQWAKNTQNRQDSFAFFAASGSNVQWISSHRFLMIPVAKDSTFFVLGSISKRNPLSENQLKATHLYYLSYRDIAYLPFQRQVASGAYSFAANKRGHSVAVGGSYLTPASGDSVSFLSANFGKTWQASKTMPHGYRSSVIYVPKAKMWICTGTNGTDVSTDDGINWSKTAFSGYNVCAASRHYIWFAGNKGSWQRVEITDFVAKP